MSYYFIEILWNGTSHISMFIPGGLSFVFIGLISEYYSKSKKSILKVLVISCLLITVIELIFGIIYNKALNLDIWDYSGIRFNFMGQICLKYSIYWFFLSLPAILLYDYVRYWLFGEEKPKYKLI